MRSTFAVLLMGLMLVQSAWAKDLKPANFAKWPDYYSAKLSPSGEYMAVGLGHGSDASMVVLDAKTFKQIGGAKFQYPKAVGSFHWVNDERLVVKIVESNEWEHEPKFYGELFAVDYDGSKGKMIYGYSAGRNSGPSRLKKSKSTFGWANIESYLHDDPDHILISSTPMSADMKKFATLMKLNVYSGKMNRVNYAPAPAATFVVDQKGQERFSLGLDDDGNKLFFEYDVTKEEWLPFPHINMGDGFYPLVLDTEGKHLFYLNDADTDVRGLFKIALESKQITPLYVDEKVDITGIEFNQELDGVYAVRIDNGFPEYLVFNNEEEEAEVFKALLGTFQGMAVTIISRTMDGNKWAVHVSSDTLPAAYYLFDKKELKLTALFDNLNGMPEAKMGTTQPLNVEVRDGTVIPAYLTMPTAANKPVPLVTLVHGGPHGVRDYWGFDREVQMLANEGYAVLRVNYRGSGGYGHAFKESGYQRWGDLIQHDIIDVTKWVQALPEINGDKTCIMGASFGAYSALQSSILAGDVFDCAVANAGVYDLERMHDEGDVPEFFWGESFLESVLGVDEAKLREFSPVNNVANLNAPVLIAHGEKDRRAPFSHAKALREAMEKADKSFEWFVRSTETHGFYDVENRTAYYEKVAEFLKKHLR